MRCRCMHSYALRSESMYAMPMRESERQCVKTPPHSFLASQNRSYDWLVRKPRSTPSTPPSSECGSAGSDGSDGATM